MFKNVLNAHLISKGPMVIIKTQTGIQYLDVFLQIVSVIISFTAFKYVSISHSHAVYLLTWQTRWQNNQDNVFLGHQ